MNKVLVAIYIDPDFYPPTINAILNLAVKSKEVVVISRNNCLHNFPFPKNVKQVKIGSFATVRQMEVQSTFRKIGYFIRFCKEIWKRARTEEVKLIILYDAFALFAYYLVKFGLKKKYTWYHNHDMPQRNAGSRYSIGRLAANNEFPAMKKIDFFSLPDEERIQYYEGIKKKEQIFILPNFPSLKVYSSISLSKAPEEKIRIIYQGFIGQGHGLESLIEILNHKIEDCNLELILKGSVTNSYKSALQAKALELRVEDKLVFYGIGPYQNVKDITASCHIGIGINTNIDKVSLSQATASNKIFEYAAVGLPVILNNSEQFKKRLKKEPWIFLTEVNGVDLLKIINQIAKGWNNYSKQARQAFEQRLNFENYFQPIYGKIESTMNEGL